MTDADVRRKHRSNCESVRRERWLPTARFDRAEGAKGMDVEHTASSLQRSLDCLRCWRITISLTLAIIPAVVAASVTLVQNT